MKLQRERMMRIQIKFAIAILWLPLVITQASANPYTNELIENIYSNPQWSCIQKRWYAMEYLNSLSDQDLAQSTLNYIDEKNEACIYSTPNHAVTVVNDSSTNSHYTATENTPRRSNVRPEHFSALLSGTEQHSRTPRTHSSTSHRTNNSSPQYYGSSCDCRAHRICVGPRGGRYCITSGGNKRYNPF